MNCRLEPFATTTSPISWDVLNKKVSGQVNSDRLTSLPDELLIQILSLLPTKYAAATCVLCTKLRHIFPFITALDFDASPIDLCLKRPYAVERYPTFVRFVDAVLRAYKSKYLTRFSLHVGSAALRSVYAHGDCNGYECRQGCLPDLKLEHIGAFVSFPLTLCGLRELDLSIVVREPKNGGAQPQLPPAIFTCETLEVLKLVVNLRLDHLVAMPSYRLPNLKLLLLSVSSVSDEGFLTRLVSSCPLLEDLTYKPCSDNHVHHITIVSNSLQRLSILTHKDDSVSDDNPDLVLIDTPNLEYLTYEDNLAWCYSFSDMNRLVEANLLTDRMLQTEDVEVSYQQMFSLIRPLSHVKRLTLSHLFMREFDCAGEKVLNDQLPLFPNLKHLALIRSSDNYCWDKLMLPLLNCSPVLETLVFVKGLCQRHEFELSPYESELVELEQQFFRTARAIPLCCRYYLKKIVINDCIGVDRELVIIEFLLRHALVLEEVVVSLSEANVLRRSYRGRMLLKNSVMNALENLPKASAACSVQVL